MRFKQKPASRLRISGNINLVSHDVTPLSVSIEPRIHHMYDFSVIIHDVGETLKDKHTHPLREGHTFHQKLVTIIWILITYYRYVACAEQSENQ